MNVKPIVTKRVYQEIIAQFVEMIRSGQIQTGEKLPAERILAEMFHVSRPSVREALRAMETIGLVEIRAGGGAYVTNLNLAPFINTFAPLLTAHEGFELELLDLRELLEIRSVELAAESRDDATLESLDEAVSMMEMAAVEKDNAKGLEGDLLFHKRITEGSGNYILQKASEFVNSLLEISIEGGRAIVLKEDRDMVQLSRDHREILEAVRKGDAPAARKRMSDHLGNVKSLYRRHIR